MTGRDLIIYILSNGLENEPIFEHGMLVGFITVEEAAEKLGVGTATIFALVQQNQLEAVFIGSKLMISDGSCNVLGGFNE